MRKVLFLFVLVGIMSSAGAIAAEERVVNLFTCELNEGKTQEDVQAANRHWVRFMNENVAGGDIRSFPATPIVGEFTKFIYIDSFPSLKSWAEMVEVESADSDEIKEIMAGLDAAATCSRNALYRAIESG